MRAIGLNVCAILVTLGITPSAEACRVFQSPEQRLAETRARNANLHVALVRITEARPLSFPMSGELRRRIPGYEDPWRATASVTRLLAGKQSPELLVFDRGWGSAACDDGTKMPSKGAKWVIYYVPGSRGEAEILQTYPVAVALRADPRLSGSIRLQK